MDKLKKVKEALEFYANFIYESGLVFVKKKDLPLLVNSEFKKYYDKGQIARGALEEINEFIEGSGWRPIETAPEEKEVMVCYLLKVPQIDGGKYGMRLAVYRPQSYHDYCDPAGWYTDLDVDGLHIGEEPTHWKPRPEPPD